MTWTPPHPLTPVLPIGRLQQEGPESRINTYLARGTLNRADIGEKEGGTSGPACFRGSNIRLCKIGQLVRGTTGSDKRRYVSGIYFVKSFFKTPYLFLIFFGWFLISIRGLLPDTHVRDRKLRFSDRRRPRRGPNWTGSQWKTPFILSKACQHVFWLLFSEEELHR